MAEPIPLTSAAVVQVDALVCRRAGRTIFEGVGLAVAPGGALLLRGPNGSGKSSLLRVLAGLLPPAAGEVAVPAGDFHYIGHSDPLKPALTVEENLAFVAAVLGGGDVEAGLRSFALVRLADTPARHLSSGQRRRLTLARLAAVERQLWLLDEPAVGLDVQSRTRLEGLIEGHRERGGAVIAASHGDVTLRGASVLELGG